MPEWEDKLIKQMQDRMTGSAMSTAPSIDLLQAAFSATVAEFIKSIQRINEALGISVDVKGDVGDNRVRWSYGQRALATRYDPESAKFFVTCDLGDSLVIEEIVAHDGIVVDSKDRPTSPKELAERFVTLLFAGEAG